MANRGVNEEELARVVDFVTDGVATEEQLGVVLKQMQISISTKLLAQLKQQEALMVNVSSMLQRLYDRLDMIISTDLEMMNVETVMDLIEKLTRLSNNYLELQRRIVQGKELFSNDTLSDDEKRVIKLMNSFSSQDDKKKFMAVVKERLGDGK